MPVDESKGADKSRGHSLVNTGVQQILCDAPQLILVDCFVVVQRSHEGGNNAAQLHRAFRPSAISSSEERAVSIEISWKRLIRSC